MRIPGTVTQPSSKWPCNFKTASLVPAGGFNAFQKGGILGFCGNLLPLKNVETCRQSDELELTHVPASLLGRNVIEYKFFLWNEQIMICRQ